MRTRFHWAENHSAHTLIAPSGLCAATVFKQKDTFGHNWFVWDENGVGGENSTEPTIAAAKFAAEVATLRWGKHPDGTKQNA